MALNGSAPWHRASFDRFIQERLPALLADRLPLAGYRLESTGVYTCALKVVIGGESGDVELGFENLPQPDRDGVFLIDGDYRVVVPVPSRPELDVAEVRCVGEQLYDFFAARIGETPESLPWDAALARTWLPIDAWMRAFHATEPTSQYLQTTNWLDRHTHLRRLTLVPIFPHALGVEQVFTPGQLGRTCPFCTPEGPNIARLLEIAQGADIQDGRLVIVDDRPEATLGLAAATIPFLEHTDANRLLMGVNMMRQWIPPAIPEPALVRTGNEPDAPEFWCGYNLLTAFIPWDGDAFEDAIVISASCAKRLRYAAPVEPGDKFSNRYGAKGVISRILPDDDMPRLPDGTPVELIYSLCGLPSRMNFGQVREAVMGRIAKAEGKPAIVPPFHAPDDGELRERLKQAGLPEDGMEALTLKGKKLPYRSTVGWVYWGCTVHIARDKIRASVGEKGSQHLGVFESAVLMEAKAFETVRELYNTLAEDREDAESLAARVASGPVNQAPAPSPNFTDLTRRLAAAGIRAELRGEDISFRFAPPEAPVLKLTRPVPHPWGHGLLTEVGAFEELPEHGALVEADTRLGRALKSQAPESLTGKAVARLETRARAFFDALLSPEHLRFQSRLLFSGRAVIAPGPDLRTDQVGLAEEIAWTLFGPLVIREIKNEKEVQSRSKRAAQALDALMSRAWVILTRAPALRPTNFLAFHPVRCPDRTLRLHPLACELMDADFDGDQAAVLLPVTEAAQREAGEILSIAGHLARDPDLIRALAPRMDAAFGLANLSLSSKGRKEVADLAGGIEMEKEGQIVTRGTLIMALRILLARDGAQKALEASERLSRRGFEVAKTLGASMNPFLGASLNQPPAPETDDQDQWKAYSEEMFGWASSCGEFTDNDFGTIRFLAQSGARGSLRQIVQYLNAPGIVLNARGNVVPVRHGFREGMTPEEVFARVVGARRGLAQIVSEMGEVGMGVKERIVPTGYGVLARARRSSRPGIVFARAAANGEIDSLTDVDSRLFVGLPVKG